MSTLYNDIYENVMAQWLWTMLKYACNSLHSNQLYYSIYNHSLIWSGPLTLYQNKFLLCNCNIWKKFGLVCLLAVIMMVSYFFLKGTCGPMAWSKNVLLLDQIFDQDWLLVLLEKVIMRLWKHQVLHIW